jgi:inhibitor of KinA sporulation pathway (predicted exonuclease)
VEFTQVLAEFDDWLLKIVGHRLREMSSEGKGSDTAFLTCGDWDCKHVHTQCETSGVPAPQAFRRWVNIKRSYEDLYGGQFRGMKSMLAKLRLLDRDGEVAHGFHHLGMHDVENICRCALYVLERHGELSVNGWISRRRAGF